MNVLLFLVLVKRCLLQVLYIFRYELLRRQQREVDLFLVTSLAETGIHTAREAVPAARDSFCSRVVSCVPKAGYRRLTGIYPVNPADELHAAPPGYSARQPVISPHGGWPRAPDTADPSG